MRTNFPNKKQGKRLFRTFYSENAPYLWERSARVLFSFLLSFDFILVVSLSSRKSRKYCRRPLSIVFALPLSFFEALSLPTGKTDSNALISGHPGVTPGKPLAFAQRRLQVLPTQEQDF